MRYLFRYIFYHWKQKYLCRYGWHRVPKWMRDNTVRYMSYTCAWCACTIDNTKNMNPKCLKDGHNWKMQHDGWTLNPKWKLPEDGKLNTLAGMTKKNIYYKCARCPAYGYNEKHS